MVSLVSYTLTTTSGGKLGSSATETVVSPVVVLPYASETVSLNVYSPGLARKFVVFPSASSAT